MILGLSEVVCEKVLWVNIGSLYMLVVMSIYCFDLYMLTYSEFLIIRKIETGST